MAEIVSIIGITHNPFMPRLFKQPQQPPGAAKVKERIAMMRQKLAEAKPDVLVCIGNDHLHQFFMDNMPAFMIGKMDQYDGTFYDEEREFGLPKCKLPGDVDVSDAIMEGAFDRGVDFAYSNELTIDHSIIVPMLFVRPEMDIPVVPILTNCIAPPMPRAQSIFRSRQSHSWRHRQPADKQAHRRPRERPSLPRSWRPETIRAPFDRPEI